jgi:hypothetical protein
MRRTFEIETSQFDPNKKGWSFGCDYWVADATVEYPDELDELSDDELGEMASNEQGGVRWVTEEIQ